MNHRTTVASFRKPALRAPDENIERCCAFDLKQLLDGRNGATHRPYALRANHSSLITDREFLIAESLDRHPESSNAPRIQRFEIR